MPDQPTDNEAGLLLQVAEGDEKAFSSLYYTYHHRLGIYLYQLTSSRPFAEEILQDVFCKVWEKRDQLPAIENFQAWLFTISKNHALNCLRSAVRERLQKKVWEKDQVDLSVLDQVSSEDQLQLIDKAISQLPPQQKKVFMLSRYKRLKYIEIAQELNLSKETIKSYLQIATTSIRKYVNNHLPLLLWWLFY
jgi:RNA polymerase sigma-70 factor (family 1)